MWLPFIYTHLHFTVNIFAALILLAVSWLYFDAWTGHKNFREALRALGFLLLASSFAFNSTHMETAIFGSFLIPDQILSILINLTRIVGYVLVIFSHLIDPLQPKPKLNLVFPAYTNLLFPFILPALSLFSALMYLRRSTTGLERHLRTVGLSFLILFVAESGAALCSLDQTANTILYRFVAPFGPIWLFHHLALFVFSLILLRWVSGYLLKRFSSQLALVFTSLTLTVFTFTTIAFTFVLIRQLESQSLAQLETDAKILNYALESKQKTLLSDTQIIAQDPQTALLIASPNRQSLVTLLSTFLINKNQTTALIASPSGIIFARGEDPEKYGDSVSDQFLFTHVLATASPQASVYIHPGSVHPTISLQAAAPVLDTQKRVVGIVLVETDLDNAFLDYLKSATGLEASLYAGTQLAATTFTTPDGSTRPLGISETNPKVKTAVYDQKQLFTGSVSLFGRHYLAAYLPLTNLENQPVGMVFTGRNQVQILQTAGLAIQTTFIVTLVLLSISLIPSFLIAGSISRQIK